MKRLREGLLGKGDNPKAEMPFLDHLEELRWRILWSLLALIIGAVIGLVLVLYFDVVSLLVRPAVQLFGDDFRLLTLAPETQIIVLLQLALLVGLVLASPLIVYQIWAFFSPALEDHERRALVPSLIMGLVLFLSGVALAYFIVLPMALRFLAGILIQYLDPSWTANYYLGFVIKLLLAFGIVFELPVVVLLLSVLGLITPQFLRSKRRHAIVAILILASFLSPGDLINVTIMMMIPLVALYEFSIFLSVLMWRRRDAKMEQADAEAPEDSVEASPYGHGDPAGGSTAAEGAREKGEG